MSEQHEVEVEGVRFRMVKLGGIAGRELALRVLRLLGPYASKLGTPGSQDAGNVLGMCSNVDPAEVTVIVNALGKVSQINVGPDQWLNLKPEVQDVHFAGRLKLQFGWFGASIQYQLADFFG